MLNRFLEECKIIKNKEGFKIAYDRLANKMNFVSLMPAKVLDLFPLHILQNEARFLNPYNLLNVYFVPLSENGFMGATNLENIVLDIYNKNIISKDILDYARLESTVLLHHPLINRYFNLNEYKNVNIIYQSYNLENQTYAHVFYIYEDYLFVYKNMFEAYRIELDLLIDYKEGLGLWNEKNMLFSYLKNPKYDYICPKFYFREYDRYNKIDNELIYRKSFCDFICEIFKLN